MKTNIYFKLISLVFCILIFSCNEDRIGENEFGSIKGTVVASGTNKKGVPQPIESIL